MSRSTRKTPVLGMIGGGSEKNDKRICNRRVRRSAKQQLHPDAEDIIIINKREAYDTWDMGKDGKVRFDAVKYPEYMRK